MVKDTVSLIQGELKSTGKWETQAIRYPTEKWSKGEAAASCEKHGGSFEPAKEDTVNARQTTFVQNIQHAREETVDGIQYLVAPVVLLVEGVHNGFLYTADEIAASADAWNAAAVVAPHPKRNGEYVSARVPVVYHEETIGQLFNVHFDENEAKLRGEVWIDILRAEKKDPELLNMIRSGKRLEVSTGLLASDDGTPGKWNTEDYEATLFGYTPDHLALLPKSEGACSWSDGCGIRANLHLPEEYRRNRPVSGIAANIMINDDSTGEIVVPTEPQAEPRKETSMKDRLARFMQRIGLIAAEEMSDDEKRNKLNDLIRPKKEAEEMDASPWVRAVYDDYFVYEVMEDGKTTLYKQSYAMTDAGPALAGDATEVVEKREFVPAEASAGELLPKEVVMDNKMLVDALIACERTRFVECDRAWLEKLPVEQLEKMRAPEPPAPPEPPKTVEEFVNSAPEAMKPTLLHALESDKVLSEKEKAEKDVLVKKLLENKRCEFTAEELGAKDAKELQRLITLSSGETNYVAAAGGTTEPEHKTAPDPNEAWEASKPK